MSDRTMKISLGLGAGGTLTTTAHETETPGLFAYDLFPVGDSWRLIHHSGATLAEFTTRDALTAAVRAMAAVTDWTVGADVLRTVMDDSVIWKSIDAIEGAGGEFLPNPGGRGERIAAERQAALAAQTGGDSDA
ncbi:hypothetical protein ACWF94_03545 [Streptomyces sp. NPDC055078]